MARMSQVRIGDRWTIRVRGQRRKAEVVAKRTVPRTAFQLKNMASGKTYPKWRSASFLRIWASGIGHCSGCGKTGTRIIKVANGQHSVICHAEDRRDDCAAKHYERIECEVAETRKRLGMEPNPKKEA